MLDWALSTTAPPCCAACVAALYWGTNYPAQYGWTGGSFLRQGWLVASVLALCALRRGRAATAGALLALAIGLRIFPIFILAALFGIFHNASPWWLNGAAVVYVVARAAHMLCYYANVPLARSGSFVVALIAVIVMLAAGVGAGFR